MAISISTVVKYLRKGDKGDTGAAGKDGTTIKEQVVYYCTTASATNSSDIHTNWDEGELETIWCYDGGTEDWTKALVQPTEEQPYLWRYAATGYSNGDIVDEGPTCIGHYGKQGETGEQGPQGKQGVQGPYIQYRGKWDTTKVYYNTTTGDGVQVIDVVKYGDAADDYFMCLKTNIGQNPETDYNTDSVYWTRANFQEFIASQLLLSENAVITFSQNQQILLQDADGNITAGAKGASTSANDIRFWAGTTGTSPDLEAAPFRVYEDGSVVATKATVEGKVTASSGSFTDGKFTRCVMENCSALSGTFQEVTVSGDVTAFTMGLKISTADSGVPNGALCYGANDITLSELPVNTFRVIKIVNPVATRTVAVDLVLRCATSNVRVQEGMDGASYVQGGTKTIAGGGYNSGRYYELLGYRGDDAVTYWMLSTLDSI